MNLLSLFSAMLASAFFIGSFYCLTRNRKSGLNIFSFLVLLLLGWWSLCHAFFFSAANAEEAWLWHRLASIGWIGFIPATTYYFIVLTGLNRKMKSFAVQFAFYALPAILLAYNLFGNTTSMSKDMVKSHIGNQWSFLNSPDNIWLWLYIFCLVSYFGTSFYLLIHWAFSVKHRLKKTMALAFVALDALTILLGFLTDVLSPLINQWFPALANLCTAVFAAGYFLIILRFDLFNVRNVVKDRDIIQHSTEALMVVDEVDEILDVNRACVKLLCSESEKLIGNKIYDYIDKQAYITLVSSQLKEKDSVNNASISFIPDEKRKKQLMISASVIRDKKREYIGTVLSVRDITALYNLNEKYKRLAFIDTLTGLPNRRKTFNYLKKCEEKYMSDGTDFFILYMDLNDFKSVNDRFGHNKGDAFLKMVSERLRKCVGESIKFLGRLSGDEFLMSGYVSGADVDFDTYIRNIETEFYPEFIVDGIIIKSGISVGCAVYSESGDIDSMVHNADKKMYNMKQNKKSLLK